MTSYVAGLIEIASLAFRRASARTWDLHVRQSGDYAEFMEDQESPSVTPYDERGTTRSSC